MEKYNILADLGDDVFLASYDENVFIIKYGTSNDEINLLKFIKYNSKLRACNNLLYEILDKNTIVLYYNDHDILHDLVIRGELSHERQTSILKKLIRLIQVFHDHNVSNLNIDIRHIIVDNNDNVKLIYFEDTKLNGTHKTSDIHNLGLVAYAMAHGHEYKSGYPHTAYADYNELIMKLIMTESINLNATYNDLLIL